MGHCTQDRQDPVPTPTPALPNGTSTPDPSCGRGRLVNQTTKSGGKATVCCQKATMELLLSASVISEATTAPNKTVPTTCSRSGKAATFNVTEVKDFSINGSDVRVVPTATAAEACNSLCCMEPQCAAWTWYRNTPGTFECTHTCLQCMLSCLRRIRCFMIL